MKFKGIEQSGASRKRIVRDLMLSASVVVAMSGTAFAQDNTGPQSTPTAPSGSDGQFQNVEVQADDIVVTGYRASIEESLSQKREANAFVDVITAEDVGKFPDKNVADALQRVPGVSISRDGGEGSRVSIRGLSSDLTLTELNGNFIASADDNPSRSFNYLLLPANLIGSVEVFKSSEARLDEGGVGGVIINHTRKPFDLKPWSGTISAEGTYSDVTKKVEPQLSGLLSWHNEDKTFGVLLAATYQDRTNRSLGANTESWQWWSDSQTGQPATDVNGNTYANDDAIAYWGEGTTTRSGKHYSGYWAPQSVDETVLVQQRKRLGIQATAQMRPFDNFEVTANYFRFQVKGNQTNNVLKIPEWGYGNFFTDATFDKSGTVLQSATFQVPAEGTECRARANPCTMETPAMQSYFDRQKTVSNTYDVHGDWNLGRLNVSFALGKTKASGGPSFQFFVQAKPRKVTGTGAAGNVNGNFLSQWGFNDQSVDMAFSPELQQNLMNGISQVDLGSTGSGFSNSEISQRYAQVDVTRKFDSFIDSIQVGAKWRNARVHRETGRFEWYSDAANTRRYQDTSGAAVTQPDFFLSQPIDNIAGGFTTNVFPAFNVPRYLDYLNATYSGPIRVDEPENQYDIREKIWAGYTQLNFKSGPVRGNIGLRVANTKQSGVSTDVITYERDYCRNGPAGPFDPNVPVGPDGNCQVIPRDGDANTPARQVKVFSPNSESKQYTDWLPSFNISWDVTPNLLFRAAASKVIARPGYGDLAGARSLTFNSDEFVFDRRQFGALPGWFGGGGNFDLKPFNAWQYDAGLEWYFARGSVIGATAFRKDVKDFIVPLVLDIQSEVAGQQVTVQQYSTQANGSKAVSQGIEVYAQHTLPFGLGAQVNFTYNDTSVADVTLNGTKVGTSPLVGSAKTQINGSIFYETDKVLLRASYNRKGETVGGIQSGLNAYGDPYEQVDLNASYSFFDNLQLTASVINLTKSEQRWHLGNDTKARFLSNEYSGRRAYLGLAYKF
ncbi:TonB-dependent receptor [Sphingomonas psychrotolerans]|uniref:TonB-dependent receptor n=1 Tax=Sphingomonas psychrotolerans TaxID=1327635 RepID=A0ABU3N239_9SPHN|nr:TonB-dependent receptor [Sphingomonas psychrotolerans]MDT8758306.1 TonB-dependent receptor [Sphingomonas psychrotolerans]